MIGGVEMKANGLLAGLALLVAGCTPVHRAARVSDWDLGHPMKGKRVGIAYARGSVPGAEGIDERHLGEFLGGLASAIKAARPGVADYTEREDIPWSRSEVRPDTGVFRILERQYAVPDSSALRRLPDSLDCLVLMSAFSFGSGPIDTPIPYLPAARPEFPPKPGLPPDHMDAARPMDLDRGRVEDRASLLFVVWDIRQDTAMGFGRITGSNRFSGEASFAQDGERFGRAILKRMNHLGKSKPAKAVSDSSRGRAGRR